MGATTAAIHRVRIGSVRTEAAPIQVVRFRWASGVTTSAQAGFGTMDWQASLPMEKGSPCRGFPSPWNFEA